MSANAKRSACTCLTSSTMSAAVTATQYPQTSRQQPAPRRVEHLAGHQPRAELAPVGVRASQWQLVWHRAGPGCLAGGVGAIPGHTSLAFRLVSLDATAGQGHEHFFNAQAMTLLLTLNSLKPAYGLACCVHTLRSVQESTGARAHCESDALHRALRCLLESICKNCKLLETR